MPPERLVVSGAAAVPTAGGAEIVLSRSAPADVSVEMLNVAGRPVATVVQDRGTEAGPQRVVWNGQSMNGTAAPTGLYLVRVAARAAEGSQSSALAAVSLR
jgi:flagellar hook assembly protein FlgD